MERNLAFILQIDGQCGDDPRLVAEFIKECLAEVEGRLVLMNKLFNLDVVLESVTFSKARSDLAGIRHIAQAIMQAAGHHRDCPGGIGEALANAYQAINASLMKAEAIFTEMEKLYP